MEHTLFDFIEDELKRAETFKEIAVRNANVPEQEEWLKNFTYEEKVLHYYLMEYAQKLNNQPQHLKIVTDLDFIFNYKLERERKPNAPFNNLTCRRNLSKMLEKLAYAVGTKAVFTGHGYTDEDWKIDRRILELEIIGKKAFRKKAICQLKRARQNQMSWDFKEQQIKEYTMKISEYDKQIEKTRTLIKDLEEKMKMSNKIKGDE